MQEVVALSLLIVAAFAALQLSGGIIKFVWKMAPTILFIVLIFGYLHHKVYEGTKNAEHTGLTQVEGTGDQRTPKWLYDKVFPEIESGGQSK